MRLSKELANKIKNFIKQHCCCVTEFGITTLNPPVDAPTESQPSVLINLTTGGIWYWDGDSWEVYSGDGGFFTPTVAPAVVEPEVPIVQDANGNDFNLENVKELHFIVNEYGAIELAGTNTIVGVGGSGAFISSEGAATVNGDTSVSISSDNVVNISTPSTNFLTTPAEDNSVPVLLGLESGGGVRVVERPLSVYLTITGAGGVSSITYERSDSGVSTAISDQSTGVIWLSLTGAPIYLGNNYFFQISNGTNIAAPNLSIYYVSATTIAIETKDITNTSADLDGTINVELTLWPI